MTDTHEARGPHLPDVLTRQSPWVYVFVGAALVHVAAAWLDLPGRGPFTAPQEILSLLWGPAENAVISLFGAALFIRHPDARRSLPLLAFGLGLLALEPLLLLVDDPITRFIDSLAPSGEEFVGFAPAVIAYHVLTSLIGVAAVLYVGAGLMDVRTRPQRPEERMILVLLAITGIATVAWELLPIGGVPANPYQWALVGISFVLSLLYALAWSYVITVAFGGWAAGEEPRLGWGLALVAGAIGLVVRIVNTVLMVMANVSQPVSTPLLPFVSAADSLGWLLFLAAFAVGLPATADPPAATPPGSEAG